MGDRGHVTVTNSAHWDDEVVLYAHWKASELPAIVAEALAHEQRWKDTEYLTRIIFDEISSHCSDFTGCGIGTETHGDVWRVIDVDTHERAISFRDANGYGSDPHVHETYSFTEFVAEFHEDPETAREFEEKAKTA